MARHAEILPAEKTVTTLSAQLIWNHFVTIIPFKDKVQLNFYTESKYYWVSMALAVVASLTRFKNSVRKPNKSFPRAGPARSITSLYVNVFT
jgi:hypothetical protein